MKHAERMSVARDELRAFLAANPTATATACMRHLNNTRHEGQRLGMTHDELRREMARMPAAQFNPPRLVVSPPAPPKPIPIEVEVPGTLTKETRFFVPGLVVWRTAFRAARSPRDGASEGVAAMNTCRNGHALTPDNIYKSKCSRYRDGYQKRCRLCMKISHQEQTKTRTTLKLEAPWDAKKLARLLEASADGVPLELLAERFGVGKDFIRAKLRAKYDAERETK